MVFQSTHPLRGATPGDQALFKQRGISIHAPLAGCDRDEAVLCDYLDKFQSTHPLRGATARGLAAGCKLEHFNPRTPCGVRRRTDFHPARHGRFQSTHPLRGATAQWANINKLFKISIHAPLAGCDLLPARQDQEATISIHAPLAGCDQRGKGGAGIALVISIHAPLAGCDHAGH